MVSLHNYTCFRCLTAGTTTQWCLGNILVEISFTTYSHLLTRVTKMHLIVTCSPWKIYKWWSMRGQLLFCKLHHRQIIEFWRSRYRILKDFRTCMPPKPKRTSGPKSDVCHGRLANLSVKHSEARTKERPSVLSCTGKSFFVVDVINETGHNQGRRGGK